MLRIDRQICKACGVCADACPRRIPEVLANGADRAIGISAERLELCLECGHCAALCPTGAMQCTGLPRGQHLPGGARLPDAGELLALLETRRSVRRYKRKPVPRAQIERVIDAAHAAPCAAGRGTTGVLVLDRPAPLAQLSEALYEHFEKLARGLANPVARFFIGRSTGPATMHTLNDLVMPSMRWYIRWYREARSNEILRDCPVLMLFVHPTDEPLGQENCLIAAFHALLMCHALGLGACLNGLVPPACSRSTRARTLLALDPGHQVGAAITLGYPRYTFRRLPPRQLAEVRYID